MSGEGRGLPETDAWIAAVHASADDYAPLGSAVVIDATRVLTCAHVVMSEGTVRAPLWVAFPRAAGTASARCRVDSVRHVYVHAVRDLAVLLLADPVPAGVEPAPLRFPEGRDLVAKEWWAFGFPDRDAVGDSADGQVGAALGYGWVRLDTRSRYLIRPGFSGGGLWSPDYGAVVGIVGQAHGNGDGRAITLHQADLDLPGQKLRALDRWQAAAAGEDALGQWGWTLARDPEGVRHWRPRARGVSIDSERGWRFRGRTSALTHIVSWLGRPRPDRKVLVVTGSPGTGKSAVLGRIVTTADRAIRASLPADDTAMRAALGSVSCAVHAKGKTALEVATEIARAASARLPGSVEDLAPAIRDALGERAGRRGGRRFSVVIDALDEAASPAQARAVIDHIVLPLAETCSDAGVQVVVGTRRRDDDGDLLDRFAPALDLVDLDEARYFDEDDLAAYALACLQLAGDERPGNPYQDDAVARPLAVAIARMAGRNFLIAGLIARTHGLYDELAADPAGLEVTPTVRTALAGYLRRLAPVGGVPADRLLTALAFAEAPGLTAELWELAVEALFEVTVGAGDLAAFARSAAANFLVESAGAGTPVYRLFHQALNDALLLERESTAAHARDERRLARAFLARGRAGGWDRAPAYLLRSLPGHDRTAALVDELLTDDDYLLHADLRRLIEVADNASSPDARRRARMLRLTPEAAVATPAERVAVFSVTEALDGLGSAYRSGQWQAPYRAQWALAHERIERAAFKGHRGAVNAVCAVTVGGRQYLASGSDDATVWLWDPRTGQHTTTMEGHQYRVNALCRVTVDGGKLIASGGYDETVRLWDPATGQQTAVLNCREGSVWTLCTVTVNDRQLLASGSEYDTVHLWDPATGKQIAALAGHRGAVNAVCAVTVGGRQHLASGGDDGRIRLWNPATGKQIAALAGHDGAVSALCTVTVNDRQHLASGGNDGTVRLWNPATRKLVATLETDQEPVSALCTVTVDGRQLLATGSGDDDIVRLWDPATGQRIAALAGHHDSVWALCTVTVNDREHLASGSDDGTVRLWDTATRRRTSSSRGHQESINALCAVTVNDRQVLAGAGAVRTLRLWNPATGERIAILEGHHDPVLAMCTVTVNDRQLLASGSHDGRVRLWDPATRKQTATLEGHRGAVNGLCTVTVNDRQLLATGSDDETAGLWDPATGQRIATLENDHGAVLALCTVTVNNRQLLATGSDNETAGLWDPATGQRIATFDGHQDGVRALCPVTVNNRQLLASGGADQMVRLWDPATGEQIAVLEGHQGWVWALAAMTVNGRQLLASGSDDEMVRLWDPVTGSCRAVVPAHHPVQAVAQVADLLGIGLAAGILVIKLDRV